MNDPLHIYIGAAERLRSIDFPDQDQNISVIPTPFQIKGESVLLGKRASGQLIALFPNVDPELELKSNPLRLSNGFEIALSKLKTKDSRRMLSYVEFRNIINIDLMLFGAIIDELLTNEISLNEDLLKSINDVLNRWKEMLSLDSGRTMTLNSIVGLMGELKFLKYLMVKYGTKSLPYWTGPRGGRHDFEFSQISIEVKTTSSKTSNEISVHGLSQLENFLGKEMLILKVKIEPDPAGQSLPDLIEDIVGQRVDIRNDLMNVLKTVGYNPVHNLHYQDVKFQFVEFQVIPIDVNFPKLIRSTLNDLDPNRKIIDVQYIVNTSGFETQKTKSIEEIEIGDVL